MTYPQFDRSRLRILPLAQRIHDMTLADLLSPEDPGEPFDHPALPVLAARIRHARQVGAPVILMMGAHVIKSGLSRLLIDLMARGFVTHVAMNGAGPIHDFELALVGATTESVARYIREGQFGLWHETGRINDIIAAGNAAGLGYGEALGRAIATGDFPHRDVSVLAAGYRLRIPVTVHIGIGQDIIHEHPNCDGAALGEASYRDFLIFTEAISHLEPPQATVGHLPADAESAELGGVVLNYGTAVMGPEVYLKALAMARNVAAQEGRSINHFTTAVFDLVDLGEDTGHEAPKTEARYYYRPFKTILVRTVQDGGQSFYVRGPHRGTFPALHRLLMGERPEAVRR